MKIFFYILTAISFTFYLRAAEIQYADVSNLGKSVQAHVIAFSGDTNGVMPTSVGFELSSNTIVGIHLVYPRDISLEELRAAINQKWAVWEKSTGVTQVYAWRNEDFSFVIGVGRDEDNAPSITISSRKLQRSIPPATKS